MNGDGRCVPRRFERLGLALRRLLPPCRRVAVLVSESFDRPLTPGQRLVVRLHLFACDACARFRRQLLAIRRLLERRARP